MCILYLVAFQDLLIEFSDRFSFIFDEVLMYRIQKILLTLAVAASVYSLSAQSQLLSYEEVTSLLTADQAAELQSKGEVTAFHFGEFDTELLPPIPQSSRIEDYISSQQMNMGIEGLFLFKDFSMDDYRKDPEGYSLMLYNTLRSVSTLEGTQYYSASREEMRDLFVESWVIPDADSPKDKLPDPLVTSIPARDSFFIHQKDKSFGKNESIMEFYYESPVIAAVITNKSAMYYNSLIRVIGPDKMQIHLVIIPTDKGLLFYGVTAADSLNINAFRKKANNSFYNRVKALFHWYTEEIQ